MQNYGSTIAQNAFTYIITNISLKNEGWGINPDQGKVRVLENNKDGQISIAMDTWLEIKSVNPKGNQPWIFAGGADAKAEAPIVWSPDAKRQLIGKDPDAGKDWGQEEKRAAEDEMVG